MKTASYVVLIRYKVGDIYRAYDPNK